MYQNWDIGGREEIKIRFLGHGGCNGRKEDIFFIVLGHIKGVPEHTEDVTWKWRHSEVVERTGLLAIKREHGKIICFVSILF